VKITPTTWRLVGNMDYREYIRHVSR